MISPTPLEQLLEVAAEKRTITLGVPASVSDVDQRFPLTPEGAAKILNADARARKSLTGNGNLRLNVAVLAGEIA